MHPDKFGPAFLNRAFSVDACMDNSVGLFETTAAAPASEVEAILRFPANMAVAKIAAADVNKMTLK